mmetsp:Transcript_39014/g.99973  ORF Transcript_39014/g.99973 Transcript_39014/m.99973 type:complete len:104 (-) Transcript_39014:846-1157(-)
MQKTKCRAFLWLELDVTIQVQAGSPALEAGVLVGDKLVQTDSIKDMSTLQKQVLSAASSGGNIQLDFYRVNDTGPHIYSTRLFPRAFAGKGLTGFRIIAAESS